MTPDFEESHPSGPRAHDARELRELPARILVEFVRNSANPGVACVRPIKEVATLQASIDRVPSRKIRSNERFQPTVDSREGTFAFNEPEFLLKRHAQLSRWWQRNSHAFAMDMVLLFGANHGSSASRFRP